MECQNHLQKRWNCSWVADGSFQARRKEACNIHHNFQTKTQVQICLFFGPRQKWILAIPQGPFYTNSTQKATSQHFICLHFGIPVILSDPASDSGSLRITQDQWSDRSGSIMETTFYSGSVGITHDCSDRVGRNWQTGWSPLTHLLIIFIISRLVLTNRWVLKNEISRIPVQKHKCLYHQLLGFFFERFSCNIRRCQCVWMNTATVHICPYIIIRCWSVLKGIPIQRYSANSRCYGWV